MKLCQTSIKTDRLYHSLYHVMQKQKKRRLIYQNSMYSDKSLSLNLQQETGK